MGIKQPPSYVHPNKRKQLNLERETPSKAPVEPARYPIKKKGYKKSESKSAGEQSVQLRIVIPSPAAGQLSLHDEMLVAGYTSKQALLGLLKKGFVQFESDLLTGKVTVSLDPLETDGKPVDTTRNVSREFFEAAKALYDPFNVLSQRAFGQRVGDAIIRSARKDR